MLKHILAFCACIPTLSSRMNFDWLMRKAIKYLLASLLLFVLAGAVHAEEGKWIDGIKFRYGTLSNTTTFKLPWQERYDSIIEVNKEFSHLEDPAIFPIAITLSETLMNSWSFRGAVFEYQDTIETKDLNPVSSALFRGDLISGTTYLVQTDTLRTSLYNNFFNASDKSFADANSNWALSADTVSKQIFLGYYWGVFIPAFENHRFMKIGVGFGVLYAEFSYTLNLCSEYKISLNLKGECVGKKEIDSSSNKGYRVAQIGHITLWERVTKDSIWKFASMDLAGDTQNTSFPLKNHDNNLIQVSLGTFATEMISYTYRF